MSRADIDPDYYDAESHGYWLRTIDWDLVRRYERACVAACNVGLACWLPGYDPINDIPF